MHNRIEETDYSKTCPHCACVKPEKVVASNFSLQKAFLHHHEEHFYISNTSLRIDYYEHLPSGTLLEEHECNDYWYAGSPILQNIKTLLARDDTLLKMVLNELRKLARWQKPGPGEKRSKEEFENVLQRLPPDASLKLIAAHLDVDESTVRAYQKKYGRKLSKSAGTHVEIANRYVVDEVTVSFEPFFVARGLWGTFETRNDAINWFQEKTGKSFQISPRFSRLFSDTYEELGKDEQT